MTAGRSTSSRRPLVVPRVSEAEIERAVEAGLARTDEENWRLVERCLTPTRSQFEAFAEMQRQAPGGNPLAAVRVAGLDPRYNRAKVLTQQGLLDAAYVLLVDVLCDYPDSNSKSTVLMELVANREEAGDPESAVWFVEGRTRAEEAGVASQEAFARQIQTRLQSGRGGLLGGLMGGVTPGAAYGHVLQQHARDTRVRMLLPVATSYARLGDREKAREKLAEVQAMMAAGGPRQSGRDEESEAHLYFMLAEASARVGDVPAALRAYAEADRRRRERARPDPSGASLAFVLAELGHHAEARRLAEATLAEASGWSLEPRARVESAADSDRFGADMERVGHQLAAAAALETAHLTLVEVHVAGGDGEAALRHLGEYDRANTRRHDAQRALAAAMRGAPGTMTQLGSFMEGIQAVLGSKAYKERAHRAWRYGQAYMLASRPRDAAERLLEAVGVVENLRGLIRPEDRVAFFGRHTSPYAALVDSLLGLPRTDDLATLPAQHRGHTPAEVAFHYAEAARARLLSEQIARAFVGAAERDLPPDVRERERALQSRAVADLRRGTPYDESAAYAEFQRFVDSLRQTHPDYATLKYPVPVTARQVPLQEGEALIAYAVLERRTVAWLLTRGSPLRVFSSPVRRDELLATVEAFRRSVDASGGTLPGFDAVAAEKLYTWLLAEPLKSIPGGTTIVVVPDGVLGTLPFEALGVRGPDGTPAFAGARYPFAYIASATVLTFERTAKRIRGVAAPRPLLALGDPAYEDLDRAPAPASLERRALVTRSAREEIRKRGLLVFSPLPASRAEVTRIAATLGVPRDSPDIRLGRAANERDLKALDLGAYRYLHFATHGVLAGDVPYLNQPALVLAQTADLGGEDGFLTMSEVLKLPLRADMVVLSACQTALGREVIGEGVVGLTRAFLYAGSRAAVVSLWPVDDASTAIFMGRFYEHVTQGLSPARALARAKQDLRADRAYGHPFYWAPFVYFGGE